MKPPRASSRSCRRTRTTVPRPHNAPMPNMQRLTPRGIALHAGNLPGYPASHGCVRLPLAFSKLLYGSTQLGMTVVITAIPAVPAPSEGPALAETRAPGAQQAPLSQASYQWNPVPPGPDDLVSVVVSIADQRAVVLQGGKNIGSAPVRVSGPVNGATAYVLESWNQTGKHWLKLQSARKIDDGRGRRTRSVLTLRWLFAQPLLRRSDRAAS